MIRLRLIALAAGTLAMAGLPAALADDYTTVKGQVIVSAAPVAPDVDTTKATAQDRQHCDKDGKLKSTETVVDKETKGLKSVIVYLRPDSDDRKQTFPQDKIKPQLVNVKSVAHVIDQPCCQFEPRVLAARVGDTIEVKNSATVSHNINYKGEDNPINVTLAPGKSVTIGELKKSNSPIQFNCDIHPWMQGRVRVFDHPYFATTGADGKFEIKDVPAGTWRIVYYHERGFHKGAKGATGEKITVVKDTPLDLPALDFEFSKTAVAK